MYKELLVTELNKPAPNLNGKDIWIWGTGNTAELYREGFARLADTGFQIIGYCDSKEHEEGATYMDKPLRSAQDLHRTYVLNGGGTLCILICIWNTRALVEVEDLLGELQLEHYFIDEVIFKSHADEILSVYDSLYDEKSKEVYAKLTIQRMKGRYIEKKLVSVYPYLGKDIDGFEVNDDEIFVDCGAYIGDTIQEYCDEMKGKFCKIIAFEPDTMNFTKAKETIAESGEKYGFDCDRIELYPYGVSDSDNVMLMERNINDNGLGSKIVQGVTSSANDSHLEECRIVSLDSFLKNEPYTFLKADIESFEYKMLNGAREGIISRKPKLAICIYHNAMDFYEIPILIKKYVPEYHIAIRHHTEECFDTVCYAWI